MTGRIQDEIGVACDLVYYFFYKLYLGANGESDHVGLPSECIYSHAYQCHTSLLKLFRNPILRTNWAHRLLARNRVKGDEENSHLNQRVPS